MINTSQTSVIYSPAASPQHHQKMSSNHALETKLLTSPANISRTILQRFLFSYLIPSMSSLTTFVFNQVSFFGDESPVYHGEKGILFVYHQDGRPTGDAFVLFQTSEHSKVALTKHRQTIGKRYVELFQLSRQEIINVFTRHSLPANLLSFTTRRGSRSSTADSVNFLKNNTYLSNVRNIVRLRGLPYSASVQDILDFLEEFAKCVVPAGVHMVYNLQVRFCTQYFSIVHILTESHSI